MHLEPYHIVEGTGFRGERVRHVSHRTLDLSVEVARIANPSRCVEITSTTDKTQCA